MSTLNQVPSESEASSISPESIALKSYLKVCAGTLGEVTFNNKESAEFYQTVVAKYKRETTLEQHEINVAAASQSNGEVNKNNEKIMLLLV